MRGNKKRRERKKPSKKKKQLLRDATMLRTQAREKEKRKEKKRNPRINPKQSLFLPPCLEYPFAYEMGETFPPSLNI